MKTYELIVIIFTSTGLCVALFWQLAISWNKWAKGKNSKRSKFKYFKQNNVHAANDMLKAQQIKLNRANHANKALLLTNAVTLGALIYLLMK